MYKAYKYRIYPSEQQKEQLRQHFGCCRMIWNLALEVKITAWQKARINISRSELQTQLVELKSQYTWLYDINSQSLQSVLLHIDNAFKNFFKGKGFPRFKTKSGHQSFQCPQRVKVLEGHIVIPKIKKIRAEGIIELGGDIKTVTISRTPTGKYFASILVDHKTVTEIAKIIKPETTVGIDVGIKSFVITNDGRSFEPNRFLKSSIKRLKCLQRRVSRKKKGSKNRKKASLCVAKLHEKITNQRSDYIHKITANLIHDSQVDTYVIEDLNITGMTKNRKLAQAIMDASFGEFYRQMKYKCVWYNKNLIIINQFYPSSKRCSDCGTINESLTLADREWRCMECNTEHDRDHNAAKNILWYGLQQAIV